MPGGGWWMVGPILSGWVYATAGAPGPECDQYLAAVWSI